VRNGVRKSATMRTKAEATNWAAAQEAELISMKHGAYPRKTFAEAMHRYVDEVSAKKKGFRHEQLRLCALERDYPKLAAMVISEIDTPHMSAWRDDRLKKVSAGSVQRDINLLSNVFTIARDEWRWCGKTPFAGVRRPGDNPPRTRRVQPAEVRLLCRWLGYRSDRVATKQQEVAMAFLVGLRTGMRAGEILSLSDESVDLARRVATVEHKTQHITGRPRQVPLTRQGVRLLRRMSGRGRYFSLTSASLDALFRKARDSAGLKDLHFHDSRAEALTRLSKRVSVMDLAKISGHKDLRVLLESYYRVTAEEIAGKLV
jgi:integrase